MAEETKKSKLGQIKQALEQEAREAGILESAGSLNGHEPEIKLPTQNRLHSTFVEETGQIIGKSGALFRRALLPVIVNPKSKQLLTMTGQHFRTWAEQFVTFYRERVVDEKPYRVPVTMKLDTACAILESHAFIFSLPEVRRLNPTRLPVIRLDGRCELLEPGYFSERGIFTLDDGIEYDLTMTCEQATKILRDYFKEYPLNERSLACQIAAMLTPYCVCMITDNSRPPCFIYTANAPRAGKSMLAKWPNITLYGFAATRTLPRFEETRKVLDTIALQGDSYVIFDNIHGKIQGSEIEQFLASSFVSVRPLGQSVEVKLENNAVVFFTGNQLERSHDMADRALFIELLVQEVDSRERKFSRIINDAFVAERRSEIRSALWAMVKSWDAAGRPIGERLMNGFETWSQIVPGIVKHAGFGDCLSRPIIKGASDETDDISALVKALAPDLDSGETESKHEFDDLMKVVKELGLFESEEVRGGRRDQDLFDKDGNVTRSGRSLFGKLFIRYDRRKFLIGANAFSFLVIGRGDSRRYHVTLSD